MAERLRYAKAFINAGTEIHDALIKRSSAHTFGREIELVLLTLAILIGDAEGRPMNESKLALYTGMPRTTVQRKLLILLQREVVVRDGMTFRLSSRARENTQHVDRVRAAMLSI